MFAFNPLIDYRIHIKLHEYEAEDILKILTSYYDILHDKNEKFYLALDTVLIGYRIGKILRTEYEKRQANILIGLRPKKTKPYILRLNKLEIIWLYHLTRGYNGLFDDLRINRLGIYIITDIPEEYDNPTDI